MAKRGPRRSPDRARGQVGDIEAAVVSVARRDPVDVAKALRRLRALKTDEERASALVDMAFDVDVATVIEFLDPMTEISSLLHKYASARLKEI